MLWDMIYNSESRLNNVSVGINGLNPQSLENLNMDLLLFQLAREQVKPGLLKAQELKI